MGLWSRYCVPGCLLQGVSTDIAGEKMQRRGVDKLAVRWLVEPANRQDKSSLNFNRIDTYRRYAVRAQTHASGVALMVTCTCLPTYTYGLKEGHTPRNSTYRNTAPHGRVRSHNHFAGFREDRPRGRDRMEVLGKDNMQSGFRIRLVSNAISARLVPGLNSLTWGVRRANPARKTSGALQ